MLLCGACAFLRCMRLFAPPAWDQDGAGSERLSAAATLMGLRLHPGAALLVGMPGRLRTEKRLGIPCFGISSLFDGQKRENAGEKGRVFPTGRC